MKRLLLFALLAGLVCAAQPVGAERGVATVNPDEITPGMMGYGLSVFRGVEPERFEVEALGVLHNVFPGRDLILIRAYGTEVEKAGIIAGMSGSPVFFDGRLAGAVAYSWNFQKEPIGLVTAASDMLELIETDDAAPALRPYPQAGKPAAEGLRPIGTPLFIGGLSGKTFAEVSEFFSEYGFVPLQGGGAQGTAGPGEESLVPGAAFGVQLARGDVDYTGIGTVTWREGDKLVGFGHPMYQLQGAEYPLVTATILTTQPSYASSFKIGVGGQEVGSISIDRASGVAGEIGATAPMVPVTLQVRGADLSRTYEVETIDHPFLLFPITASVIASSLEQSFGMGEMVCRFRSTFSFTGYPDLVIEDALYSPGFLDVYQMLMPLLLIDNPWEELRPERVAVEVDVKPGRGFAEVESIRTDHQEVTPGEEITVRVGLRPYAGAPEEVPIKVTVPAWLEPGTPLALRVGPANELLWRPPVRDIATALRVLGSRGRGDELQATLLLPRQTSYFAGQAYPDLPAAVSEVLHSPTRSALGDGQLPEYVMQRQPVGYVVRGTHELSLTVVEP